MCIKHTARFETKHDYPCDTTNSNCWLPVFLFMTCQGLNKEKLLPLLFAECWQKWNMWGAFVYLQRVLFSVFWVQRLTVIGEVDHGKWHCCCHCGDQHSLHHLQTRAMDVPKTHTHQITLNLTLIIHIITLLDNKTLDFPRWQGYFFMNAMKPV